MAATYLTNLTCADCDTIYDGAREQHRCSCGGILFARYDLDQLARDLPPAAIAARPWGDGLWRYAELLPLSKDAERLSLGEGATPLLPFAWLSPERGIQPGPKAEGLHPTGTFKARGAGVGGPLAKALGAGTIALPTAGNAGAAWAAYGARAGISVIVAMPRDAPALNQQAVRLS